MKNTILLIYILVIGSLSYSQEWVATPYTFSKHCSTQASYYWEITDTLTETGSWIFEEAHPLVDNFYIIYNIDIKMSPQAAKSQRGALLTFNDKYAYLFVYSETEIIEKKDPKDTEFYVVSVLHLNSKNIWEYQAQGWLRMFPNMTTLIMEDSLIEYHE